MDASDSRKARRDFDRPVPSFFFLRHSLLLVLALFLRPFPLECAGPGAQAPRVAIQVYAKTPDGLVWYPQNLVVVTREKGESVTDGSGVAVFSGVTLEQKKEGALTVDAVILQGEVTLNLTTGDAGRRSATGRYCITNFKTPVKLAVPSRKTDEMTFNIVILTIEQKYMNGTTPAVARGEIKFVPFLSQAGTRVAPNIVDMKVSNYLKDPSKTNVIELFFPASSPGAFKSRLSYKDRSGWTSWQKAYIYSEDDPGRIGSTDPYNISNTQELSPMPPSSDKDIVLEVYSLDDIVMRMKKELRDAGVISRTGLNNLDKVRVELTDEGRYYFENSIVHIPRSADLSVRSNREDYLHEWSHAVSECAFGISEPGGAHNPWQRVCFTLALSEGRNNFFAMTILNILGISLSEVFSVDTLVKELTSKEALHSGQPCGRSIEGAVAVALSEYYRERCSGDWKEVLKSYLKDLKRYNNYMEDAYLYFETIGKNDPDGIRKKRRQIMVLCHIMDPEPGKLVLKAKQSSGEPLPPVLAPQSEMTIVPHITYDGDPLRDDFEKVLFLDWTYPEKPGQELCREQGIRQPFVFKPGNLKGKHKIKCELRRPFTDKPAPLAVYEYEFCIENLKLGISPDPARPAPGGKVTLKAAFDAQARADIEAACGGPLRFRWQRDAADAGEGEKISFKTDGEASEIILLSAVAEDAAGGKKKDGLVIATCRLDLKKGKNDLSIRITGGSEAEPGQAVELSAYDGSGSPLPDSLTFEWLDGSAPIGSTRAVSFSSSEEGEHAITLRVGGTLDGAPVDPPPATHTVTVKKTETSSLPGEGTVRLKAPDKVMATDIFDVAAVAGGTIAPRAKSWSWYGPAIISGNSQASVKMQFPPGETGERTITASALEDPQGYTGIAQGQHTVLVVPASMEASAPDTWEGGTHPGGLHIKRKPVVKKRKNPDNFMSNPGQVVDSATVSGSLSLAWKTSFAPATMEELEQEVKNYALWPSMPERCGAQYETRPVTIGDFKGFILENKDVGFRYRGSGYVDLAFPEAGAAGYGMVMKGKVCIEISYSIWGSGAALGEGTFWYDDKPFLLSEARNAKNEVLGLLSGLRVTPDGTFKTRPATKITLVPSKTERIVPGEIVTVKAVVENPPPGETPFFFEWAGSGETGDTVDVQVVKPGRMTVAVTARGKGSYAGSASVDLDVSDIKVTVEKMPAGHEPVVLGAPVGLKAVVSSGGATPSGPFILHWQPHPELHFDAQDGPSLQTQTRFTRPGRQNVWVEVLIRQGDALTSLARSENLEIDVAAPTFRISFDPPQPLAGDEAKAVVTSPQNIEDLVFTWDLPSNVNMLKESQNRSEILFYLKDTEKALVTAKARVADTGDAAGEAEASVQAIPYTVKAACLGRMGPKPKIFNPKTGLAEETSEIAVSENIRLQATIEPKPGRDFSFRWTVNDGSHFAGGAVGSTVEVYRSETGECAATVTAEDKNGVRLGKDQTGFSAVLTEEVLRQPRKDDGRLNDLLARAKDALSKGNIEEAVSLVKQAAAIDTDKAADLMDSVAAAAKDSGWEHVSSRDFPKAIPLLEAVADLDPRDADVSDMLEKARAFSAVWASVQAEAEQFQDHAGRKKIVSARRALDRVCELQKDMPGGTSNTFTSQMEQRYENLLKEYSSDIASFREKHVVCVRNSDYSAMKINAENALKGELLPEDEKEARSWLQTAETGAAGEQSGKTQGQGESAEAPSLSQPAHGTAAPSATFEGSWATDWGTMTLHVNGQQVTGTYDYKGGAITGSLSTDGKILEGYWSQNPSRQPPNDKGRFRFTLSGDGQRFSGTWGYGTDADHRGWGGTRIAPQPAAEKPEARSFGLKVRKLLDAEKNSSLPRGLAVTKVSAGSAASVAGLKPGDVILFAAGAAVSSSADIKKALDGPGHQQTIRLLVLRQGGKTVCLLMPSQPDTSGKRSSIGISARALNEEEKAVLSQAGLMITDISPGMPAGKAGMRKSDILLFAGDDLAVSPEVLKKALEGIPSRGQLDLLLVRQGKELPCTIEAAE